MPTVNYSRVSWGNWTKPSGGSWSHQASGVPYTGGQNPDGNDPIWDGYNTYSVSVVPTAVVSTATLALSPNGPSGGGAGISYSCHACASDPTGNPPANGVSDFLGTVVGNTGPTLTVTSTAQKWINGTLASNGFTTLHCHNSHSLGETSHFTAFDGGTLSITYDTPPTQPGAFTVPVTAAIYPVNIAISTSWGASTDAEGDAITYNLYYKLNGGAETAIATGFSGNSRSWTPTTAGSYQLVVYAVAGGLTSSSRTSGTFTVVGQTHQMVI